MRTLLALLHVRGARRELFAAVFLVAFWWNADNASGRSLPVLPSPIMTPGAVATTSAAEVCAPGYARAHRHATISVRTLVYAEYRIDRHSGRFELDHLIPLELGGADVIANLWPQSESTVPGSHDKDRLENRLHALVCAGRFPVDQAQQEIAGNWIAACRTYLRLPACLNPGMSRRN
jgi:hypothetical protein